MKCVETFKTREIAQEARLRLRADGIEARVFIDSLDGRFGALQNFDDVALMVADDQVGAAQDILAKGPGRRAS